MYTAYVSFRFPFRLEAFFSPEAFPFFLLPSFDIARLGIYLIYLIYFFPTWLVWLLFLIPAWETLHFRPNSRSSAEAQLQLINNWSRGRKPMTSLIKSQRLSCFIRSPRSRSYLLNPTLQGFEKRSALIERVSGVLNYFLLFHSTLRTFFHSLKKSSRGKCSQVSSKHLHTLAFTRPPSPGLDFQHGRLCELFNLVDSFSFFLY